MKILIPYQLNLAQCVHFHTENQEKLVTITHATNYNDRKLADVNMSKMLLISQQSNLQECRSLLKLEIPLRGRSVAGLSGFS